VLHGSSGVKTESFLEAIPHGICKVNVATYLNQGFIAGMKEGLEQFADSTDPRKPLAMSRENVKERVREKMRLFGSSGVIDSSGAFRSPPKKLRSAELGAVE
jgi:fructose-bisphosphate aldolase class II